MRSEIVTAQYPCGATASGSASLPKACPIHGDECATTATNTDRELWREREGDYYADSLHVTEGGGIGMNCGGRVIVKPLREWHRLAMREHEVPPPSSSPAEAAPGIGERDFELMALAMREWARLIRLADDQDTLLKIADDIEVCAAALASSAALPVETPAPASIGDWQSIETAPKGRKIIVSWLNALGKRRTTFATFFDAGSLDMDDDAPEDAVDEDGKNTQACWFEVQEANDPGYWPLIEHLTHWMPLPDPPALPGEGPASSVISQKDDDDHAR